MLLLGVRETRAAKIEEGMCEKANGLFTPSTISGTFNTKAPVGSPVFLDFLQRVTVPLRASRCVFTYGDLRMDNIIVHRQNDQDYCISGIIDWEMGGFYPEDFECTKITNTLATNEASDWYLHLPYCVSPERHPGRWLADHAWDKQVV